MKKVTCYSLLFILPEIILAQEPKPIWLSFHQGLKDRFIEGGLSFMMLTLICLVLGLVIFIKKLNDLSRSTTSNQRFLQEIEKNLSQPDRQKPLIVPRLDAAASRVCQAGLDQTNRGFIKVQETIESALSVERGTMLNGLTWISLFISLAPMLGFMGTVLGMIQAFDAIASIDAGGNMSPSLVADGIKVALITTVSGLVIAVILQLLYNYLLHKIEIFMTDLEDTCGTFIDLLIHDQIQQ